MDVTLYDDGQVVFGRDGAWSNATWDQGTYLDSGLLVRQPLAISGVQWNTDRMLDEFFSTGSTGPVWGDGGAGGEGLIWGLRGLRAEGLIWGIRGGYGGSNSGSGSSSSGTGGV
jgi:hypothetical protein